jgi:hypothetical protein
MTRRAASSCCSQLAHYIRTAFGVYEMLAISALDCTPRGDELKNLSTPACDARYLKESPFIVKNSNFLFS